MKARFKFIPAVYLILEKDNTILLARRFNTGYQDGMYSMIAGHLDGDESLKTGLIREALEEGGITLHPDDLKLVHVMHCRSEIANTTDDERVNFYFKATTYEGELTNMEEDKCDELIWVSPTDLPDKIIPHVRLAIERSIAGKLYSDNGWDGSHADN